MKYSQMLLPTVKETPADAEIPSHRLMVRAGYIRKLASGTYTYLPLGVRCLKKISAIVREELDATGAQEIIMPILQPMELWQQTGRNEVFKDIICSFTDRHGRVNILAPTAEEVVTALVAAEIRSYKQLPINLYQIAPKFRDEFRPRFGVLRSREFLMKDAYSFDSSVEGLAQSYNKMRDAYWRIFARCSLRVVTVEADSGGIGGTDTEEFMVPCDAGEDILLTSDKGNYAANVEKAQTSSRQYDLAGDPTGEIDVVDTPKCKTIEEVTTFFRKKIRTKLKPANMLKTLVCKTTLSDDGDKTKVPAWIVAVVRGDHELNENKILAAAQKQFAQIASVQLAEEKEASQAQFAIGFVGPHCLTDIPNAIIIADFDAATGGFWVSGANEIDKHIRHFNWQRDVLEPLGNAARMFVDDIRNAIEGDPSPKDDGGVLRESRGIEVGHVFKLGTKYSEILGATFLDEDGVDKPCIMGTYGIGINRILASVIETGSDDDGCVLPVGIAPFDVEVIGLNSDSKQVADESQRIYDQLIAAGIDTLLDDRPARPGVKFKDADLIGIPLRIVIGDRGLSEGNVEIKMRTDDKPTIIPADQAAKKAIDIIEQLKA